MAISYLTAFAEAGATNSVTFTISDAGSAGRLLQAKGDLALVYLTVKGATNPTWTVPSGFVQVGSTVGHAYAGNWASALFYKFVDESLDYGTFTFSSGSTSTVAFATWFYYRGVDPTTPFDGVAPLQSAQTPAATSHVIPAITPATTGAEVVAFVAGTNDNGAGASGWTPGAITGWQQLVNTATSTGDDASMFIGRIANATGGAPAATLTIAQPSAVMYPTYSVVALRPATGLIVGRNYRTRSTVITSRTTAGDVSCPAPFPVSTGQFLLVGVVGDGYGAQTVTASSLSGWTAGPTIAGVIKTYWKFAESATPAMPVFTLANPDATAPNGTMCYVGTNIDAADPLGTSGANAYSGSSVTSLASTGIAVDADTCTVLHWYIMERAAVSVTALDAGTRSLVTRGDLLKTTNLGDLSFGLAIDTRNEPAGTSDTLTATVSAGVTAWRSLVIQLNNAQQDDFVISAVDQGGADTTTTITTFSAIESYVVSEATVTAAAVATAITPARIPQRPRRELLWVSGLTGEQIGVIT